MTALIWWLWACAAPPAPAPVDDPPAPPRYAGSERCAGCHLAETAAWAGSHHARAEVPATADDPPLPDGVTAARFVGVSPLRQPVVDGPGDDGRWQVYGLAWDPARSEWFAPQADVRAPGEWGHWTGRGMTWNSQCAACHTTAFEKRYDAVADRYDSTWAELGVGCESCHGPGGHGGGPAADRCADCHSRRSDLTDDPRPAPFLDRFAPAFPDLGDAWWPDGRARDEVFAWAAFAGSKMQDAGVTCQDCHEPHRGTLRAEGDALCLRCHGPEADPPGLARPAPDAGDHSHHAGVGCADCHLPTTVYMQRDPRHDHGFSLPDPELTVSIGLPSACASCHDEPARTLAAAARAWWGEIPGRERTLALQAARDADPAGRDPLLRLAAAPGNARWRATATAALGAWPDDPQVQAALDQLTRDPEPLVRFAAVGAGASPGAVAPLRADPVRAVRVAAGRATSPTAPPHPDWLAALAQQADQPLARVERGQWQLARGHTEGLADLQWAARWDPSSVETLRQLAIGQALVGQPTAALATLERAAALPDATAETWTSLGLAAAAAGDAGRASTALEEATRRDPTHEAAWRNLGLLRAQAGEVDAALDALRRADRADPRSPAAAYARAAVLRDAGRIADAQSACDALLARFPTHAAGLALRRALASPPPRP